MYIYFGRVGGGYRWAMVYIAKGGVVSVYIYERGPETKWETVYRGKDRKLSNLLTSAFEIVSNALRQVAFRVRSASLRELAAVAAALGNKELAEELLAAEEEEDG